MKTKTKKRNPQDATFRNIDALKKRVAALERQLKRLVDVVGYDRCTAESLSEGVLALIKRVAALEQPTKKGRGKKKAKSSK